MVCIKIMNRTDQQAFEELLAEYFEDLVIELNLRMLADTTEQVCACEPLLWVERITVTGVVYPEIPQRKDFSQKKDFWHGIADKLKSIQKRIKIR